VTKKVRQPSRKIVNHKNGYQEIDKTIISTVEKNIYSSPIKQPSAGLAVSRILNNQSFASPSPHLEGQRANFEQKTSYVNEVESRKIDTRSRKERSVVKSQKVRHMKEGHRESLRSKSRAKVTTGNEKNAPNEGVRTVRGGLDAMRPGKITGGIYNSKPKIKGILKHKKSSNG